MILEWLNSDFLQGILSKINFMHIHTTCRNYRAFKKAFVDQLFFLESTQIFGMMEQIIGHNMKLGKIFQQMQTA